MERRKLIIAMQVLKEVSVEFPDNNDSIDEKLE